MKTKTNNQNQNQNTLKTEPSDDDKALAELVRMKVLDFCRGMKKLCKDNGLSFEISGWVEDPVDRGDTPNNTRTFRCGNGDVCQILIHKIIDIYSMQQDCIKKCSYNEVARLCTMSKNLIGYVCKKVMTKLNNNNNSDYETKKKKKK